MPLELRSCAGECLWRERRRQHSHFGALAHPASGAGGHRSSGCRAGSGDAHVVCGEQPSHGAGQRVSARRCDMQRPGDVRLRARLPNDFGRELSGNVAVDQATDTIYVTNANDNNVSVIDGASCNAEVTTGCNRTPPTVAVGGQPVDVSVDESTDTVYVANWGNGAGTTVSVIDGAICNARHHLWLRPQAGVNHHRSRSCRRRRGPGHGHGVRGDGRAKRSRGGVGDRRGRLQRQDHLGLRPQATFGYGSAPGRPITTSPLRSTTPRARSTSQTGRTTRSR